MPRGIVMSCKRRHGGCVSAVQLCRFYHSRRRLSSRFRSLLLLLLILMLVVTMMLQRKQGMRFGTYWKEGRRTGWKSRVLMMGRRCTSPIDQAEDVRLVLLVLLRVNRIPAIVISRLVARLPSSGLIVV